MSTSLNEKENEKEEIEHVETQHVTKGDLNAEFYAQYGTTRDIGEQENEQVRRKIDMYLLPIVCYIYFCQQLDKSSLSFSAVFGIQTDAHLHGQDYAWLSSIVYFAQLIMQPVSVYALVKVPVNYWICGCFTGWSISLLLMVAMKSFAGLAVMRFLLGGFEASIAPSMLVVTSMWWTRREQVFRNNMWYAMNGIATIIGSLLSFGLGHIHSSKLHEYQVIFLGIGLLSLAFCIPTWFIFPRHPTKVRWLNQDQKYVALERIRLNQTGTQTHEFKWAHVREACTDPKSIIFVLMVFCVSLVSGGIGAFGPLILKGFGLTPFQTILYNMIPGGISIATLLITAYVITKTKLKSPVLFVVSLFPLAAAIALDVLPRGDAYKHKLLAVYFILQVFGCITPILFTWIFANTAGHTKKTTMTGLIYIGLCTGNIVGPQLYKAAEKPYYHTGLKANMAVLACLSALILVQTFYLHMLNKRNERRRVAAGKPAKVIDNSLEASSKWEATGQGEQEITDMTDLQNEDFVYSL